MPFPSLNRPSRHKPMNVLDVERMCDIMEQKIREIRKRNREAADKGTKPTVFFAFADLHEAAGFMCEWSNMNYAEETD